VTARKSKIKATALLGLNAVGKPYSPSYDPNYKMNFGRTKITRLYAPYGPGMFADDQSTADEKRKRRQFPRPVPLLTQGFSLTSFMREVLHARGMSDDAIARLTVEQTALAIAEATPEQMAAAKRGDEMRAGFEKVATEEETGIP
jgi:hypothetical protein